jgi:hypothetical protein
MKKFTTLFLVVALLGFVNLARAAQPVYSGMKTSTGTSVQIVLSPPQQNPGAHLAQYPSIFFQAANSNTSVVYVCFNTQNTCTAATSGLELLPGQSFFQSIGMYTGLTTQQIGGSGMFTSDISFISASGTDSLHAIIE